MKCCVLVITSVLSMFLAGCIPTLHPVYTNGDVVFDKLLVGTWEPEDGNGTWEFTQATGKHYRFIFTDKDGKTGEFEANLARFDGLTYLDLKPTQKGISGNDLYKAYLLPIHTFLRVDDLAADTLKLSSVNGNWLKQQLSDNPKILHHESLDEGFLVTASSKELQAFLKRHNDTPGAFAAVSTLHRR